ncbi:MAG: hypothetical protein IPN53_26060 [Comamonadaceae bacterium]|nr:hypothetical protein [Comamonadaceae bacterium]
MLDSFFGSLSVDGDWQRGITDRGFAQARQVVLTCLEHLNTFVAKPLTVGLASWHGLRWQAMPVLTRFALVSPQGSMPKLINACLSCICRALN